MQPVRICEAVRVVKKGSRSYRLYEGDELVIRATFKHGVWSQRRKILEYLATQNGRCRLHLFLGGSFTLEPYF